MKLIVFSLTFAVIISACSASTSSSSSTNSPKDAELSGNNSQSKQEGASLQDSSGPNESSPSTVDYSEYKIITLLPRDAIPAIDNPKYYDVAEANKEYADEEQVIGVVFDGEARAYSTGKLSNHEIVNDTVGGRPISVTW